MKQKLETKIAAGIAHGRNEIEKYVESNWFRFRQLWEVDKESFIAVYESEHTDLQGLEADIARSASTPHSCTRERSIACPFSGTPK